MRIFMLLLCLVFCGCPTVYEKSRGDLKADIEILKLELRKARLENELRDLENQK